MNIEKLIAKEAARQAGLARYHAKLHDPLYVARAFWTKVKQGALSECWPFFGCLNELGYGQLTHKHKKWKAHRFAYYLTYGPFDLSLCVRHKCDNPPCCNPLHLELGTKYENTHDMMRRGRHHSPGVKGEAHPFSKLTEQAVREIRFKFDTGECDQGELAEYFGVTPENIHAIVLRKAWRHV